MRTLTEMEQPRSSAAAGTGLVTDPVFVLCNGGSGSTLLRFVLDAHPDLACPPETNHRRPAWPRIP